MVLNRQILTFDLIKVFISYPNLRQSIWLAVSNGVREVSNANACKNIATCLLQDHIEVVDEG